MIRSKIAMTTTIILASLATTAALAQDYGNRGLRFGNTSGWYFDGRGDNRDFRTNGSFPGNFAADPFGAAFGAAGLFGSNPWRSVAPYPSQVYFGSERPQAYCNRHHRSRDPSSDTFIGKDGARHRC